jgi:hypothetical protein
MKATNIGIGLILGYGLGRWAVSRLDPDAAFVADRLRAWKVDQAIADAAAAEDHRQTSA